MFPFSTVSRIKKQDIDHLSKPYHIYIYIYRDANVFTYSKEVARPAVKFFNQLTKFGKASLRTAILLSPPYIFPAAT
jgi:polyphosphate kinase